MANSAMSRLASGTCLGITLSLNPVVLIGDIYATGDVVVGSGQMYVIGDEGDIRTGQGDIFPVLPPPSPPRRRPRPGEGDIRSKYSPGGSREVKRDIL
jgi:hypothetical protein